jgi:glycosyltransferase involved in cell wall biosynthesis
LKVLGHQVRLTCRRAESTAKLVREYGVADHVAWTDSRWPWQYIAAGRQWNSPDVLHLINVSVVGNSMAIATRNSATWILSDWDEWMSRMPVSLGIRARGLLLELAARRFSDAFVFSSSHLRDLYRRRIPQLPTAYIPYGTNLGDPGPPESFGVSLPSGTPWILYLGSLDRAYTRDLDELLRAATPTRQLGCGLVIIGNGSELPRLKEVLKNALPQEKVIFTGRLPSAGCDAVARHPSIRACFLPISDTLQNRCRCPNKLFHYMGGQKPIITNRVGEVSANLGDLGYYYNYEDTASLSSAIAAAISGKPQYDLRLLDCKPQRHEAAQQTA